MTEPTAADPLASDPLASDPLAADTTAPATAPAHGIRNQRIAGGHTSRTARRLGLGEYRGSAYPSGGWWYSTEEVEQVRRAMGHVERDPARTERLPRNLGALARELGVGAHYPEARIDGRKVAKGWWYTPAEVEQVHRERDRRHLKIQKANREACFQRQQPRTSLTLRERVVASFEAELRDPLSPRCGDQRAAWAYCCLAVGYEGPMQETQLDSREASLERDALLDRYTRAQPDAQTLCRCMAPARGGRPA